MDPRISSTPPDVVTVSSDTPPPAPRTSFSEVLSASAVPAVAAPAFVQGAEGAMTTLPGSPITAMSVRGPAPAPLPAGTSLAPPNLAPAVTGMPMPMGAGLPLAPPVPLGAPTGMMPEGPGTAAGPSAAAAIGSALLTGLPGMLMGDGGIQSSMIQSQQMNLYYLQLQQEVDAQNRTFTTLSNVLKSQNVSEKNAIGNMH